MITDDKTTKSAISTRIMQTLRWIPRPNKRIGPCTEKSFLLQLQMWWKHQ